MVSPKMKTGVRATARRILINAASLTPPLLEDAPCPLEVFPPLSTAAPRIVF
jgi:hypothetical protein